MLALAVTGDVGAGKSTVAKLWEQAGAALLDADRIVHALWRRGDILRRAVDRWGPHILDERGALIPGKAAEAAFGDEREYRWLCDLLHPPVRIEMERAAASLDGWVVAEIPLLFEGGVPWWIDATVYVTASDSVRLRRNAARGWDDGEIRRREAHLLPRSQKKRLATMVIENDGSLEDLNRRAEVMARDFAAMAGLCRASVSFPTREAAQAYASFLQDARLGTRMTFTDDRHADGSEVVGLTFVTTERAFAELNAGLASPESALSLSGIRRMAYGAREALWRELQR
ncbi:MAG TPA: dephospho-CoA kinase [Synergistaceae bacterium]|nr:dephospho-CoA kinase [Synergistaceae bacterium]